MAMVNLEVLRLIALAEEWWPGYRIRLQPETHLPVVAEHICSPGGEEVALDYRLNPSGVVAAVCDDCRRVWVYLPC